MTETASVKRVGLGLLAAVVLAIGASACSAGHVDKAGGSTPRQQLVLTLAAHNDDEEAYKPFVAAVDRLSDGALRIKVVQNWRNTGTPSEIDYERGIVSDVRVGKAQLGIVGVRVWDLLGLTDFQALVAPFLIDSLTLEQRALDSPFATRALASIRQARVIGVALLPGRLRRPLGLTRPLIGLQNYTGARIAIRLGLVAEETFHALGAHTAGYIPGQLSGFDGTDLDLFGITAEGYDQNARELTANVALWPKPWTIVMNTAAFARLTHAQQQLLLAAGRAAVMPELVQIAHDQRIGLSNLCSEKFPLQTATAAELAALRKAVQPVYDRIERNTLTKQWIAQIARMRSSAAPDVAHCPS